MTTQKHLTIMQLQSRSQYSALQLMMYKAGFARKYSKLPKIPSLKDLDQYILRVCPQSLIKF